MGHHISDYRVGYRVTIEELEDSSYDELMKAIRQREDDCWRSMANAIHSVDKPKPKWRVLLGKRLRQLANRIDRPLTPR